MSLRAFEADYLCLGPKADGLWFGGFARDTHVSDKAEYDPALPVHLSVDSGVFTGAVWLQVRKRPDGSDLVTVFADYLDGPGLVEGREHLAAEANARMILEVGRTHCNGRKDVISTDPAGGSRNAVGPTVIGEYCRAGLCDERYLRRWPIGPVSDALALVESFVTPAAGGPSLLIHKRCERTIQAFESYRRAKRQGQWMDFPEDPAHPEEDLIDALKGGLKVAFPDARKPEPVRRRVAARSVF